MDPVDRRARNRTHKPSIEGLEGRRLLATALPDIAMVSANTADSMSVTFDYSVNNAPLTQPVDFTVYRSATPRLGANADPEQVGNLTVTPPGGQGAATLDSAAAPATSQGSHVLSVPIPGGLPPDPSHPYVVVVADPQNAVVESDKTNNSADFHTYIVGVISHGGLQPRSWYKTGPPWEGRMATKLLDEGYDAVIPFNWAADSSHAGAAARQAVRLESLIVQAAGQFPAGSPVDLHLIGHSEGAVVNSQALLRLNAAGLPANLKAGYIKMTMLDPHAANNAVHGPQYSVAEGILGWIARQEINGYQSRAHDPVVYVPSNVQDAEVFYQHTPVQKAQTNSGLYNLWGQVPVYGSPAAYYDLTAPGVSHAGKFSVHDWYQINVVPTLATGGKFVTTDALTGSQVTAAPEPTQSGGRQSVTYAGLAAPGARVRLYAGLTDTKYLKPIGHAPAAPDGTWTITSLPISPGTYRVAAISNAPSGPRRLPSSMRPTAWFGRLTVGPTKADPVTG